MNSHIPHGYTYLDVIVAFAIAGFFILFIAAFAIPVRQFQRERDNARVEAMDDMSQALLEWSYTDRAAFNAFFDTLQGKRAMIGTAPTCLGSYGSACSDADLLDSCVNVYETGLRAFLPVVGVDPNKEYSQEKTGFYIERTDEGYAVGACSPEASEKLTIEAEVR